MNAHEITILSFLRDRIQLKVPIFQRNFSWNKKQFEQLWNDIERLTIDEKVESHFIGSIVFIHGGLYQSGIIPQLTLIDGQQRITTITLLLFALGNMMEKNKEEHYSISKDKIVDYYIVNSHEIGDLHYKLYLNKDDNQQLRNLLTEKDIVLEDSNLIRTCYMYFLNKIQNTELHLDKIWEALQRLIIVSISLDREKDNPQLIFQSLNSTGLDLTQGDLIRNYLLMNLDEKKMVNLYEKYWLPLEKKFDLRTNNKEFDRFFRDYMIAISKYKPKLNEISLKFKDFSKKVINEDKEKLLKDLYKYSSYYTNIIYCNESDIKILEVLKDLNYLKITSCLPFLLNIYDDYNQGIFSKDAFIEILNFIESFIFRRSICKLLGRAEHYIFTKVYNEIDKANYLESFKTALRLNRDYKRFPLNEEFKFYFINQDVFHNRLKKYILQKIENFERKEQISIENYQLEHIMPQTITEGWKSELGRNWKEIHNKYLHTIGNLTLTKYNPEMSNNIFIMKRDTEGGYADSPLRLNRDLAKLENWNEEEIKKRTLRIYRKAIKVWPFPYEIK